MQTSAALKKIFFDPRAVFAEVGGERKWVPAVVFMAVLLGVHGFVTAVGTYSQRSVEDLIESQSPIEFTKQDASENAPDVGDAIEPNEERHNTQNTESGIDSKLFGRVLFVIFALVVLIPVAYGLLCFLFFLEAIYFRIVGAILGLEFKLTDWFRLCAWSRVPGIALSVVAITVGLLTLGRQPHSEDLEILRLTRWLELPEVIHGGENWSVTTNFDHIDAHLLWVVVLQTIGFQEWSGKSLFFSFGVVVIPLLIIMAIALAVILLT